MEREITASRICEWEIVRFLIGVNGILIGSNWIVQIILLDAEKLNFGSVGICSGHISDFKVGHTCLGRADDPDK